MSLVAVRPVTIAPGVVLGDRQLVLIAGPCVIEGEAMLLDIAGELRRVAERLGLRLVCKGSYRKANRSALGSYVGPGDEVGLVPTSPTPPPTPDLL